MHDTTKNIEMHASSRFIADLADEGSYRHSRSPDSGRSAILDDSYGVRTTEPDGRDFRDWVVAG